MKNSKFKQVVLDILFLKSKKVTLLLGTFVPFFVCHIYAYASIVFGINHSKKEYSKDVWASYLGYFMLAVICMLFVYVVAFSGVNGASLPAPIKIFFISISVLLLFGLNLAVSYSYYKFSLKED
jgi:hypothetical protein